MLSSKRLPIVLCSLKTCCITPYVTCLNSSSESSLSPGGLQIGIGLPLSFVLLCFWIFLSKIFLSKASGFRFASAFAPAQSPAAYPPPYIHQACRHEP